MAKILIGIVAALACFVFAESLKCNKCTIGLAGLCFFSSSETCSTNSSVCYTTKANFPAIGSFSGFSRLGCTESTTCTNNTASSNGTLPLINVEYKITTACCSTDECNTVTGAASTATLSLSALSVVALFTMWGSYM